MDCTANDSKYHIKLKFENNLLQTESVHAPELRKLAIDSVSPTKALIQLKQEINPSENDNEYHIDVKVEDDPLQFELKNEPDLRKMAVSNMDSCIGEKQYHCSFCDKSFAKNSYLQDHKKIHTGERPYQCSYCDTCFTTKNYLKIHIRKHAGKKEKSYQCDHCYKSFACKQSLVRHHRIHTWEDKNSEEKPYQCQHCDKRFTTKGYLEIHKRMHTGEKPYQCNHCYKSFAQKQVLVKHQRV
ncbi:unnamed protein product, partial [Meganyctiphanes norvegica]